MIGSKEGRGRPQSYETKDVEGVSLTIIGATESIGRGCFSIIEQPEINFLQNCRRNAFAPPVC